MPRTIESILANHRAAESLRRQGRPTWLHEVDIKSLLGDLPNERSSEDCFRLLSSIALKLRQKLPVAWFEVDNTDFDPEIDEAVGYLEEETAESIDEEVKRRHLDGPDDVVDEHLDRLYDWADARRVWLG